MIGRCGVGCYLGENILRFLLVEHYIECVVNSCMCTNWYLRSLSSHPSQPFFSYRSGHDCVCGEDTALLPNNQPSCQPTFGRLRCWQDQAQQNYFHTSTTRRTGIRIRPNALSWCVYAGEASSAARIGRSQDTGRCCCVCNVIRISCVANPIRGPEGAQAVSRFLIGHNAISC